MVGSLIASLIAVVSFVPRTSPLAPLLDPPSNGAGAASTVAYRSLSAQLDNHILANLLTDAPIRHSDIPLTVVAGEVTRCQSKTCAVPLTLRVSGAEGPVTLGFAVANAKGELSEVHHAACGSGSCSVSLILERGMNTVSIGVVDGLKRTSAYTTLRVNANRAVAATPGKTEWF
jgi:hypothetical protein